MPVDPVLHALAEHWDSTQAPLAAAGVAGQFRELVARLTASGATAEDRSDTIEELVDLLVRTLPAGHPVQVAIFSDPRYRSVAPAEEDVLDQDARDQEGARDEERLLEELRRLLDLEAAWAAPTVTEAPAAAASSSPPEIMRDAVARLLAAPALSAAELRGRGGDPDQEHLISLDGPGGRQLPVFQFDAGGRPLRLVLDINALLDADADPWGVADWWLRRNAWLSQTPAQALGQVADEVLLGVARAIVERD
jgi:hypothetical protein